MGTDSRTMRAKRRCAGRTATGRETGCCAVFPRSRPRFAAARRSAWPGRHRRVPEILWNSAGS